MWKQPWRFFEGWTICIGLFIIGTFLQLSIGKINPESFKFPINVIIGTIFLLCLLFFHIRSDKIKKLRWFTGRQAALTSLSALLFLVILMGLTRQLSHTIDVSSEKFLIRLGFMQMTVSWQFILISFYFLWVLGLVTLRRLSSFRMKDLGFVLNHGGLFIVFFTAILGSCDLQRLIMSVPINVPEWRATNSKNEIVELPLAIELNSFTIDEYPPKLMLLDNKTGEVLPKKKPKNVAIEETPFVTELLGWKLEITKYLPYAAGVHTKDSLKFVEYYSDGATSALYVKAQNITDGDTTEGWISCGNFMFQYAALRLNENVSLIMLDREPRRYVSDVTVYIKKGDTKNALIEVNKPFSIDGWKIYQSSYETFRGKWSTYSVFELVKDPWLPAVYAGIVMLLIGSILLLFTKHKKIV